MNSEALLLSFYYRSQGTLRRTFISPHRTNDDAEYYRRRIATLNQTFQLAVTSLTVDDLSEFPDACICGNILSTSGGNLRFYCPACWQRKSRRPPFEIHDFRFFLQQYIKLSSPYIADLYYAAAIHLESRRLSHDNNSSYT